MLYFNAQYSQTFSNVQLNWATASEVNNKSFTVERSVAIGEDFIPITEVNGAGTTSSALIQAVGIAPYFDR